MIWYGTMTPDKKSPPPPNIQQKYAVRKASCMRFAKAVCPTQIILLRRHVASPSLSDPKAGCGGIGQGRCWGAALGATKAAGGTDMSSIANGDGLWCPKLSFSMTWYNMPIYDALCLFFEVEMYKPNESVLLCEDFLQISPVDFHKYISIYIHNSTFSGVGSPSIAG